jgi:hypothetical protein
LEPHIFLFHFSLTPGSKFEPKQRAHSPLLAARLASELKTDYIPYGEDSPTALLRGASIYHY